MTHRGFGAAHCASLVHCTQPRVGSHDLPSPHWFVPLTPQIALPPPGPPFGPPPPLLVSSLELPPHATTIAVATNVTLIQVFDPCEASWRMSASSRSLILPSST